MKQKYYIEGYNTSNIKEIVIRCENCDDFCIDISGIEELYVANIEKNPIIRKKYKENKYFKIMKDGIFAKIVRIVLNSKGYNSYGGTFGCLENRLIELVRNNNIFQIVIVYTSGEEITFNTEYSDNNKYKNEYQYNFLKNGMYHIEIDKEKSRTRKIYTRPEISDKIRRLITYEKAYRESIDRVYLLGDYADSSLKNPCGISSIDLFIKLVNKDESITNLKNLRRDLDRELNKEIKLIYDINSLDKEKPDIIFDKTSNELILKSLTQK